MIMKLFLLLLKAHGENIPLSFTFPMLLQQTESENEAREGDGQKNQNSKVKFKTALVLMFILSMNNFTHLDPWLEIFKVRMSIYIILKLKRNNVA